MVDTNQSDRSYLLFTESLGMVWASARSVREERSRQRYALQIFSEIKISLIRGKTGWRIGSVVPGINYYNEAKTRPKRTAIIRLFKVARQYIHGEEAHKLLFTELQKGCQHIVKFSKIEPEHFALVYTTRMLQLLGYVAVPDEILNRLRTEEISTPLLPAEVNLLETVIKTASTVSHL